MCVLAAFVAGCGMTVASATVPVPAASGEAARPASPAALAIMSPGSGTVITGTAVHVVLSLEHARVVAATSTHIRPDEGHIHLYLDNTLVYMQYGLTDDLPVTPGSHVLRAEFVASDHVPFDPRVWSQAVVFTVQR